MINETKVEGKQGKEGAQKAGKGRGYGGRQRAGGRDQNWTLQKGQSNVTVLLFCQRLKVICQGAQATFWHCTGLPWLLTNTAEVTASHPPTQTDSGYSGGVGDRDRVWVGWWCHVTMQNYGLDLSDISEGGGVIWSAGPFDPPFVATSQLSPENQHGPCKSEALLVEYIDGATKSSYERRKREVLLQSWAVTHIIHTVDDFKPEGHLIGVCVTHNVCCIYSHNHPNVKMCGPTTKIKHRITYHSNWIIWIQFS